MRPIKNVCVGFTRNPFYQIVEVVLSLEVKKRKSLDITYYRIIPVSDKC